MKLRLLTVALAFAALTVSCKEVVNVASTLSGDPVVASGSSIKQQRALTPINEISVSSGMSVEYTQADSLSLIVEAPENLLPYILTEVSDGELEVKVKSGTSLRTNGARILVHVTAPAVTEFEASAGASLAVKGTYISRNNVVSIDVSSGASFAMGSLMASAVDIEISSGASASISGISAGKLEAEASSGASLNLSGEVTVASLEASGGASISGLKAESGNVSATGGASVSTNIRNASVQSSGGGSVSTR